MELTILSLKEQVKNCYFKKLINIRLKKKQKN